MQRRVILRSEAHYSMKYIRISINIRSNAIGSFLLQRSYLKVTTNGHCLYRPLSIMNLFCPLNVEYVSCKTFLLISNSFILPFYLGLHINATTRYIQIYRKTNRWAIRYFYLNRKHRFNFNV